MKHNFIIVILLFCIWGCKNNSVEPTNYFTSTVTPGSRNFTWKSDTLKQLTPVHFMYNIWGSSEQNVWISGSFGLMHYDGNTWQKFSGGTDCIYGFSPVNIWSMTGGINNGAIVWHYDGVSWLKMGMFMLTSGNGILSINDMKGTTPNNIYGVGCFFSGKNHMAQRAIIIHYDGSIWSEVSIGYNDSQLNNICYDKTANKYYMHGAVLDVDTSKSIPLIRGETYKIFEFDGSRLKEILSTTSDNQYKSPVEIGDKVYFVGDNKLWVYNESTFLLSQDLSNSSFLVGRSKALSVKDLFFYSHIKNSISGPKYICHYNGTDIQPIYQNAEIWNFEYIGNTLFVIAQGSKGEWIVSRGLRSN